jgi:chitinase
MASSDCLAPGCPFVDGTGAAPGKCTGTAGVLSAAEINNIINTTADVTVTMDETAAVMIATWGGDQWVSFDNTETLQMKVNYANSRCLGG